MPKIIILPLPRFAIFKPSDKKSAKHSEILKNEVAIQIEVKNFANTVMVCCCNKLLNAETKSLLELEECKHLL